MPRYKAVSLKVVADGIGITLAHNTYQLDDNINRLLKLFKGRS